MIDRLVTTVRRELRSHVDPAYRQSAQRFFHEPVKILGVRTPRVRKIAAKCYLGFSRKAKKKEIFLISEKLLSSGIQEEQTIALAWAGRQVKRFEPRDFQTFERWAKRYLTNWASCDDFCSRVFGPFLLKYPALALRMKVWARSKNLWVRRISAVGLIVSLRRGRQLPLAFQLADLLLTDREDLVQKGYGWMLKVASNVFQKKIFAFVLARKNRMPRTALRYAIEKLPATLRRRAMVRSQNP